MIDSFFLRLLLCVAALLNFLWVILVVNPVL